MAGARILVSAMGAVLFLAASVTAQSTGQDGGSRRAFEVATIKEAAPEETNLNLMLSPANFAARHSTLNDLIKFAYHVKSDEQLMGGPVWAKNVYFDVQAKPAEADIEAIRKLQGLNKLEYSREMVQSLLADRFELVVTRQTQEQAVFALTIAKGGPKLTPVEGIPVRPGEGVPPPPSPPAPGAPATAGRLPSIGRTGQNQVTAKAVPMGLFAEWLSHREDMGKRSVVDETGLTGTYDFVLNGIGNGGVGDDAETSIFTALEEQLGLKLVAKKAQVEVLVIERAERPSAN